MRTPTPAAALACVAALLASPGLGRGQSGKVKPSPDELQAMVKAIEDAYKAPVEVDKDVLDELRKQYRDPRPDREDKIFRAIRRLYKTTPDQEASILREIRLAYQRPSPEQEERIFREIRKADKYPLGTVPPALQADRAEKLFRKLDRNGDGLLGTDEMPEGLRDQRARRDKNGDGFIDPEEYAAYYQTQFQAVAESVARGEIPLRVPTAAAAAPDPTSTPTPTRTPGPPAKPAAPAGKPAPLPDWFARLDTNADGQVGLYEWKAAGRPIAEFLAMDANGDGFLEAGEVQAYLAEKAKK